MEGMKAEFEKDDFFVTLYRDINDTENIIRASFSLKNRARITDEQLFEQLKEDFENLEKWRKLKELNKLKKEIEE